MSKVGRSYDIEDVDYIQMVLKGRKKGDVDQRRYFIRITFKDKKTIEFGHTFNDDVIKEKVRFVLIYFLSFRFVWRWLKEW